VTKVSTRLATSGDAEVICRIYNQGIEDRVATLETEMRTPEERRRWLAVRSPRHPVLVADFSIYGVAVDLSPRGEARIF
jgi:L-amino acid N-acyltransferase YncA